MDDWIYVVTFPIKKKGLVRYICGIIVFQLELLIMAKNIEFLKVCLKRFLCRSVLVFVKNLCEFPIVKLPS